NLAWPSLYLSTPPLGNLRPSSSIAASSGLGTSGPWRQQVWAPAGLLGANRPWCQQLLSPAGLGAGRRGRQACSPQHQFELTLASPLEPLPASQPLSRARHVRRAAGIAKAHVATAACRIEINSRRRRHPDLGQHRPRKSDAVAAKL